MRTRSSPPSGRSAIADRADDAQALAPLARLALAYAPARAREHWLTFLALDARLAAIVHGAREPMLAQLKLAWWRDRLGADPSGWPKGEPLLARLGRWQQPAELVALVDAWEALLAEPPVDSSAMAAFADGRGDALGALARQLGVSAAPACAAGRRWSITELALHSSSADEQAAARAMLAAEPRPAGDLPRALRPLAVLAGVSTSAVNRGGADALYRPASWFAAFRIGLFGR